MIRSMTGYGRAESVLMGRKLAVEMKSVNHRYLEISLRLPGMLLRPGVRDQEADRGAIFPGEDRGDRPDGQRWEYGDRRPLSP